MERVIARHNSKLLRKEPEASECNCEPDSCPVQGKCKDSAVIYKATVKSQSHPDFTYVGLTEGTFRDRLRQHESNFRTRNKKNKTKLSEKIWELEDSMEDYVIFNFRTRNKKNKTKLSEKIWELEDSMEDYELKWEIMKRAKPYHSGSDDCQLCLTEIYFIIYQPEHANLNSRNEFMNKCRHKNKYLICNS